MQHMESGPKPTSELLAAIVAEYLEPEQWIPWADSHIESIDSPPMWLLDLSMAKSSDAAYRAIWEGVVKDPTHGTICDFGDTVLGLMLLKYFEGKFSIDKFLLAAGEYSDGGNCSTDCEYFYEIHQSFEAGKLTPYHEKLTAEGLQSYLSEELEMAKCTIEKTQPILDLK